MKIIVATGNKHKLVELEKIFAGHELLMPSDVGVDFYFEETGSTYRDNSYGKAEHLFKLTGQAVLADDSGLNVKALGGAPGIYSARYGARPDGSLLESSERNIYLLGKLENAKERDAFFTCCMTLILDEYRFFIVQETMEGAIAEEPSGTEGFGYDPIFYLKDYGKTVAELPEEEKNRISHRGRAGRRMAALLDSLEEING